MKTYWQAATKEEFRPLDDDLGCDVLIVGSGIVGMSTALALTQAGYSPLVVCKGAFDDNTTCRSAGILTQETTLDLHDLVRSFGHKNVSIYLKELTNCLHETFEQFGADNAWFQRGSSIYFSANKEHDQLIEKELSTRKHFELGAELVSNAFLKQHWAKFSSALKVLNEYAIKPAHLLHSMARKAINQSARIHTFSPVESTPELSGDEFVTTIGTHKIRSKHIVWATGTHQNHAVQSRFLSQFQLASTCVVMTKASNDVLQLLEETGVINFWDSHENYNYGRYLHDGRMLIGGQDDDSFVESTALKEKDHSVQELLSWAREHHKIEIPAFECAWRAGLAIPKDGLPKVCTVQDGDNIELLASTDGLPNGLLLGQVIARKISGRETEFDGIFELP